ncbi:hypothetical protein TH0460_06490 [Helicobacter pylori]|uniref:hypothetical protein n=1 Tax=Helicobacter pylori TaxID=210 RepID=UPI0003D7A3B0
MGDKKSNTIKCNGIEVLGKLLELLGFSSTTKPNGQVVHSRDGESQYLRNSYVSMQRRNKKCNSNMSGWY